ncbi:tetratricopeptide repeat protein [bacterium]|nr:tetratricopeptide repeat protein [bacterium]
MHRLSYNAVCGIVVSCLVAGYVGSFFFVRRLRPRAFKKEFSAINSLYEKGDYRGAIAAYESLARRYKIQCMSLYYNLANAHYNANNLGKAILYYRKAQKLAPRDKEVADNLRIAQAKGGLPTLPQRASPHQSIGRKLVRLFSLFEGVAASLTFRWLLIIFVLLSVFLGRKRRYLVRISIVLAILFYMSLGATLYKAYVQKSFREAVVLDEQPMRKSPIEDGPSIKVLKEGTMARLERHHNGWCKIVVDGGKVGWIRQSDIEEI